MAVWAQNYDPLGDIWLSGLIPTIPIIFFFLAPPIFLRFWQSKRIFRFDAADVAVDGALPVSPISTQTVRHSPASIAWAWSPFLILTVFVTLWSIAPVKALFAADGPFVHLVLKLRIPFLDKLVAKVPPIVPQIASYEAVHKFDWLSATGTAIRLAAIVTIAFLRMKPADAARTFVETLKSLLTPIYSIGMVFAFAFLANYSGLSATLAPAFAHTGSAFTFFSPFFSWLRVFLTGSDTSANALFAALQANTAYQIGGSDVLLVAVNTKGGVTGTMISPGSGWSARNPTCSASPFATACRSARWSGSSPRSRLASCRG